MLTMITSEEYKNLVLVDSEYHRLSEEFKDAKEKLKLTEIALENLLLMLTKGKTTPDYKDGFKSFDIEIDINIANYINENFLTDCRLDIKHNKGETNE